jgi:hypothetical protein
MAIMPQIAMGFQMPQIQLPNQGNMLMQVAQLQQMQEANALRQAQARKLQLEEERGNALVQALRGGQPTLERLVAADPGRGFEVYKAFQEQQKAQEQQDEERRKKFVSAIYGSFEDPSLPSYGRSVRFLQQQKLTDPELDKFLGDLMFVDDATRKQQLSTLLNAIPGGGDYIRKIATEDVERGEKSARVGKIIAERDVERARLKGTLPTQPQQTELARLIAERDALPLGSPNRELYSQRIARLGQAPTTTVEVNTGENIEEGARRRSLVEEENRARVAAQAARKTLVSVDSAERVLDSDSGFKTGFGTEVKATVAGLLGALGVKDAEKFATNAQTFLKAAMDQVLARQIEQKGVQTNQDAQRMEQTFAQLGNTPAANRFVLAVFRAQSNMALEQDQFYRKWVKDKGTMKGAEDAWLEQQGNKSIFERPELKQYAPKKDAPTPLPDVINFKDLRSR